MAYIEVGVSDKRYPGIIGSVDTQPRTGRLLSELADALLRAPHTPTAGERELIAAYESGMNECRFCCSSHSLIAAAQIDEAMRLAERVRVDVDDAPISEKLRSLLRIAGAVQKSGRAVSLEMVAVARLEGATDLEIHDTVLIAAAFRICNRYVDGPGTFAADDPFAYAQKAQQIVEKDARNRLPDAARQSATFVARE